MSRRRVAQAPSAWECWRPSSYRGCDAETYSPTVVRCRYCPRVFRKCWLPSTRVLFRQAPYFSAPGPRRPYGKDPFEW